MGLNLGELYATLTIKPGNFRKELRSAMDDLDKFGKETAKLGRDVAELGAAFTAFGGVMVAEAAKYDKTVSSAVEGLSQEYSRLAVEVGKNLVPVVKEMSAALGEAADWFRDLNPKAKEAIATFARWAAGVSAAGTAVVALGKGIEVFGGVASAALSPLALQAMAVTAGLLGIVAAIGSLKRAGDGLDSSMARTGQAVNSILSNPVAAATRGIGNAIASPFGYEVSPAGGFQAKAPASPSAQGGTFGDDLKAGLSTIFGSAFDELASKFAAFGARVSGAGEGADKAGRQLVTLADQAKAVAAANAYRQGVETDIARWMEDRKTERLEGLAERGIYEKEEDGVRYQFEAPVMGTQLGDMSAAFGSMGPNAVKTIFEPVNGALLALKGAIGFFGGALGEVAGALAGGGIGAAVAVLLQHSTGFADTLAVLNGVFQSLANVLGAVLTPLQPLIASVLGLVDAIAAGLQPAFDVIASILEPFVPVIVLVGEIFKAVAPAVGMLLAAVQMVQNPMLLIASKAMPIFFEVLKFLGVTILKIVRFIAPVWNQMAWAVMSVVRGVVDAVIGFVKLFNVGGVLNGLIRSLESLRPSAGALNININDLTKSIQDLEGLSWDAAMAKAKETAEVLKGTEATRKSTEQLRQLGEELTNVPQGFKVTAARYAAMEAGDFRGPALPLPSPDVTSVPIVPPSASTAPATPQTTSTTAPQAPPVINLSVKLGTADIVREVMVEYDKRRYQRDGVPRSTQ